MDRYEIRQMTEDDLDEVVKIEQATFSKPWSMEGFLDSLHMEHTCYLVACLPDGGRILAYCGYYRSLYEADIVNVAVEQSARRMGIGEAMLRVLLDYGEKQGISKMFLEVRVSNEPAIHLYEKLGFVTVGLRKNFYVEPLEDAHVMMRMMTDGCNFH